MRELVIELRNKINTVIFWLSMALAIVVMTTGITTKLFAFGNPATLITYVIGITYSLTSLLYVILTRLTDNMFHDFERMISEYQEEEKEELKKGA